MKRGILYLVILAAVILCPEQGTDVGSLLPVEVLRLQKQEGYVVIETDTGSAGFGETLEAAIQNLKHTASGELYLDTAAFLIVSEESENLLEQIRAYVRPSIRICRGEGRIDLEDAAAYLSVHKPSVRLKLWEEGQTLEELHREYGRLKLTESTQK